MAPMLAKLGTVSECVITPAIAGLPWCALANRSVLRVALVVGEYTADYRMLL